MKITNNYTEINRNISFKKNWNTKIQLDNATKYISKEGRSIVFDSYEIHDPKGIIEDLIKAKNDLKDYISERHFDTTIDYIKSTGNYKDEKLYGIVGAGHFSTAFDIGKGRALKVSDTNPLEFRSYNSKFDIPFLSPVTKHKDLYICLQAKADVQNTTLLDILKVKRKMYKQGYTSTFDFDLTRFDQVGKYNGESYLLDSRCAVPQNNFFTKIVRYFEKNLETSTNKSLNIDEIRIMQMREIPLKDISKSEAKVILKNILKSWWKI